jgi:hypothetical protein
MIVEDYWTLQDNTYVATFPKEIGPYIKAALEVARNKKSSQYLSHIHYAIKRKWNGEYIPPDWFEPVEVQFKKDKVTMEGMELFNQNIMLQSSASPSFMAVGSGASQTYANQQQLQSEVARSSILEDGFMRAEGLFLMWDNVFDILTPSFACSEIGVFDSLIGGTMIARAILGQVVNHDYGNDYLYVQFFVATMSS